ncbi:hypothetical protein C0J52_06014 [Blattella germanica]|nr:hypothetical protein C0J52_06014 [Blattella germanica]
MFAFRPVDYIITTKVTFSEGSLLYDLWTKPPVNMYVKVFVFNITNPSEFLTGKAKMKLVEIGPYVYKHVPAYRRTRSPSSTLVVVGRSGRGSLRQSDLHLAGTFHSGLVSSSWSASQFQEAVHGPPLQIFRCLTRGLIRLRLPWTKTTRSPRTSMGEGGKSTLSTISTMPLNESYVVYRKAFCRLLPMKFNESGVTSDGFPAYFFRFPDNIFDSPDKNPENSCIPLALSLPHFLRGDPRLFDKMEGLSPNNSKHGSLLAVQPDLGLPLMVQTRMQLNLHVHNTKLNPRTMLFNNVTLPIFWIDWYFDLPDVMYRLFYLILFVAPVLQTTLTVVFALLGAILLGLAACSCNRKNTAVATKILSKSQHLLEKNTGEQSLLGRAQYKAQIVSRRSRNSSPVTR